METVKEKLMKLIVDGSNYCYKKPETFDDIPCEGCRYEAEEDCLAARIADALIEGGVTTAPDTNVGDKWVSVDERLPENEKPVLAYYGFDHDNDGELGMMFTGTLSYFCYDHEPHWQHAGNKLVVTHWMPLPEPPKEVR